MDLSYKLHACRSFPNLMPNETGQNVFLDSHRGLRFYVRFYPPERRKDYVYAREVARFLQGRVRVPAIFDTGAIRSRGTTYRYIAEHEAEGRPFRLTTENSVVLARELKRWHSLPPSKFLRLRGRELYEKKLRSLKKWIGAEPVKRIEAIYRTVAAEDIFQDPIVSHGDLALDNVILQDAGPCWVDLEQVSLRPRLADLSELITSLLLPNLIDCVEGPAGLKDAEAASGIAAFLEEYGDSGCDIGSPLLARWVLLHFLFSAAYLVHPGMPKLRRKPPLLNKNPEAAMRQRIYMVTMKSLEGSLDATPLGIVSSLKKDLRALRD